MRVHESALLVGESVVIRYAGQVDRGPGSDDRWYGDRGRSIRVRIRLDQREQGLGASRSQGFGRYTVTSWNRVS